jgi:putative addiction module component (TIGR02574 family)
MLSRSRNDVSATAPPAAPVLSPAAELLFRDASVLPAADRLALADRLSGHSPAGPQAPTASERAELNRRVEQFHTGAEPGASWEEVKGRMTGLIHQLTGRSNSGDGEERPGEES